MKKILFIDDEKNILDGYRRILRSLRSEWEMSFAEGGPAGVARLESEVFDVIVTDMKMPDIDGAGILKAAQESCPEAIRIVLSGHPELEQIVRSISVSHHFLGKPCVTEVLKDAIDRAGKLHSLLSQTDLKRLLSKIKALPTLPTTYSQLNQALADPDVAIADLAPLVEKDPSACLRILQLVNSPFFAVPQAITSIAQAMSYVGLDMVRTLVLSSAVFQPSDGLARVPGFSPEGEQQHALLTANIAKRLFDDKKMVEQAFTAGILHDIGKIVLATQLPRQLCKTLEKANKKGLPMSAIEIESGGVSHGQVGAYLLGTWGFPYPVCEAVFGHHEPAKIEHDEFGVVDAIHVANVLARKYAQRDSDAPLEEIDIEHLEHLGVAARLPEWEALAEALCEPPE